MGASDHLTSSGPPDLLSSLAGDAFPPHALAYIPDPFYVRQAWPVVF